jgi:hypothetical protein
MTLTSTQGPKKARIWLIKVKLGRSGLVPTKPVCYTTFYQKFEVKANCYDEILLSAEPTADISCWLQLVYKAAKVKALHWSESNTGLVTYKSIVTKSKKKGHS